MFRKILSYIQDPQRFATVLHSAIKQGLITQPLFANLWRMVTPTPKPEKWVFIVGCYNSGTTILLNILSEHPKISVLDEGVFRTNELITPEELGWTRMWCKVVEQVRLDSSDSCVDATAVQKDWSFFLDTKKPILLEKSIVNSARMLWLQANFPSAYFIHIVRNGYAVAEGIQRKVAGRRYPIPAEFGETYPISMCTEQWVVSNEMIEEDAKQSEHYCKITYENLCAKPYDTLLQIGEFLGLGEDLALLDVGSDWQIHGEKQQIQNMNGRSFAKLSTEDIQDVEKVALKMLQRYNYPILSKK